MNHRISAGALVVKDNEILLVRHRKEGSYDFWVAPGGGVIGTENIYEAAVREVKEETRLEVETSCPAYLEEFFEPGTRHIKTWVICHLLGGRLSIEAREAVRENIVEARFFSREEIKSEERDIFPEVLQDRFWDNPEKGFPDFEYLGMRAMAYY